MILLLAALNMCAAVLINFYVIASLASVDFRFSFDS